jgi:hypothetical protein
VTSAPFNLHKNDRNSPYAPLSVPAASANVTCKSKQLKKLSSHANNPTASKLAQTNANMRRTAEVTCPLGSAYDAKRLLSTVQALTHAEDPAYGN